MARLKLRRHLRVTSPKIVAKTETGALTILRPSVRPDRMILGGFSPILGIWYEKSVLSGLGIGPDGLCT